MTKLELPTEEIVGPSTAAAPTGAPRPPLEPLPGQSREGRPIGAARLGRGAVRVSLIGGCHADEPVGPAMLERLAGHLAARPAGDRLLERITWFIVPHVNPDGAARNAAWTTETVETVDQSGAPDRGYDLAAYARHVVRELPGDDVEFGFPRGADDHGARPENRAVAGFLAPGAPFGLHASFHGMSFAPGPWFLLEKAWIDRTGELRERLRRRVRELGYPLFDPDRGGEKGFTRIDAGFTTRPDSRAMADHFETQGDPATAARFRPSSMEYVRGLGGDPLTLVSEMPLFLLPAEGEPSRTADRPSFRLGTAGRLELHAWLARLAAERGPEGLRREAARQGIRPMPIRDQMRLQLAYLEAALGAVLDAA